jgi:hypothetical protein
MYDPIASLHRELARGNPLRRLLVRSKGELVCSVLAHVDLLDDRKAVAPGQYRQRDYRRAAPECQRPDSHYMPLTAG